MIVGLMTLIRLLPLDMVTVTLIGHFHQRACSHGKIPRTFYVISVLQFCAFLLCLFECVRSFLWLSFCVDDVNPSSKTLPDYPVLNTGFSLACCDSVASNCCQIDVISYSIIRKWSFCELFHRHPLPDTI